MEGCKMFEEFESVEKIIEKILPHNTIVIMSNTNKKVNKNRTRTNEPMDARLLLQLSAKINQRRIIPDHCHF